MGTGTTIEEVVKEDGVVFKVKTDVAGQEMTAWCSGEFIEELLNSIDFDGGENGT